MSKQKQENALSFKISDSMKLKLEQECAADSDRALSDMAKILIDEALRVRDALKKGNTKSYL